MRSWQTGFDINDVLGDHGVKVTIPKFKRQGRSQLKGEDKRSEKIAEARIHLEKAIQRTETCILDCGVKSSMAHLAEHIFIVCAFLVNFQTKIL